MRVMKTSLPVQAVVVMALACLNSPVDSMSLPDNYDADRHLVYEARGDQRHYITRDSAGLVARLVEDGSRDNLAHAAAILAALATCQELNPDDPHYGNFYWVCDDGFVEDLNAVAFVMSSLVPMMHAFGERLPAAARDQALEMIRLGMAEVVRLDVTPGYSNIAAKDVANSILAGEVLGDPALTARGVTKLAAWIGFTAANGIPYEYNSPTYYRVMLRALDPLVRLTREPEAATLGRTMLARIALSMALHTHPRTLRMSGPHSRAYQSTVNVEDEPESAQLNRWIDEGMLPVWLRAALDEQPVGFDLVETAHRARGVGISTWHGRTASLGVASQGFGEQSNVLLAHYVRPGQRPGVVYARYLKNDAWLGDFWHQTDRSTSRNLLDQGRWYGIQSGGRALGLYTPGGGNRFESAKAALVFTGFAAIDRVLVNGNEVETLPAELHDGATVVVASGEALVGVRLLPRTRLGRDAPARLAVRGDDLVLEAYNYRGPEKSFWELDWPGGFYRGKPVNGFYVEVVDAGAWPSATAFADRISSGALEVVADEGGVYAGQGERLHRVHYRRDDIDLGLTVDLIDWRLVERTVDGADPGWPMLESPVARGNRSGEIRVGNTRLLSPAGPAWLFAPNDRLAVAAYHGREPGPVTLLLPGGRVHVEQMGVGTITWLDGKVTVDALAEAGVTVEGAVLTAAPGAEAGDR